MPTVLYTQDKEILILKIPDRIHVAQKRVVCRVKTCT